ncbi:MAG: LptF/LptG family permease [Simkaniaceae bacterium]|nr:LptF/LptG family permease [Simkaniaceae bacterium]
MIPLSIQTRYISSLFFKRLFFLLFLLYLCYILFDYSIHMSEMGHHASLKFQDVVLYYFYNFIKRLDLLLPLSLLISTIHVLTSLNANHELLALLISGQNIKQIVKPIMISGLLSSLFMLAIVEFVLPNAQAYIDHFQSQYLSTPTNQTDRQIQSITFDNNSKLLFSYRNLEQNAMEDVFFIQNDKSIWHFKNLKEEEGVIKGYFVDFFYKDSHQRLVKGPSYDEMIVPFLSPPLIVATDQEKEPFENLSISELLSKIIYPFDRFHRDYYEISTQLYSKLAMPWLSLLVVIAVIPFCITFSRSSKIFLIYTMALICFVCLFTIIDACVILGQNNVVPPPIAAFGPFALIAMGFGIRFWRMR